MIGYILIALVALYVLDRQAHPRERKLPRGRIVHRSALKLPPPTQRPTIEQILERERQLRARVAAPIDYLGPYWPKDIPRHTPTETRSLK